MRHRKREDSGVVVGTDGANRIRDALDAKRDQPQSAPAGQACGDQHEFNEAVRLTCDQDKGHDGLHTQTWLPWYAWDAEGNGQRVDAPAAPASESVAVSDVETLAEVLNLSPIRCTCGRNQHDFCGTCIARHVLTTGYISPTDAAERERAAREQGWDEGWAAAVKPCSECGDDQEYPGVHASDCTTLGTPLQYGPSNPHRAKRVGE